MLSCWFNSTPIGDKKFKHKKRNESKFTIFLLTGIKLYYVKIQDIYIRLI